MWIVTQEVVVLFGGALISTSTTLVAGASR
jgi:hypothetical protein